MPGIEAESLLSTTALLTSPGCSRRDLRHCRFIICCIIESEVTDLVLDAKRPDDLEDLGGNVLASMSFYQLRNAEHDFLELILVVSEDSRHAI
jgi:hypothetical protein